jgi:hypothetical protein
VSDATFACPDLTTFAGLEKLGREVVGQRLEPDRAVLACRVVEPDQWCRRCGCEGRGGLRWALEGIVCQHLTVARDAEGLAVSWNTANDAVLAEGKRVLINDPGRFGGVRVIGVDEHVWRHTRRRDKYVTVIIDLTGIRESTASARLLGMVDCLSKQAFKTWLAEREEPWRERPPLCRAADPAHRRRPPHRQAEAAPGEPVRDRRARPGRGGLGHLPAEDRRRPRTRPGPRPRVRPRAHASSHRLGQPRRAQRADRSHHPRADPDQACRRRAGLLRPARHQQRPDRGINGRLEHLRGSALGFRNLTNYSAYVDRSWRPAASDPNDTPECEEPPILPEATDGTGTPRVVQPATRPSNWTI